MLGSNTSAEQINRLAEQFESASPREILCWANKTFGEKLAIVTSFQATGIVTLHMMQEIDPGTPILTLDTGFLFPETVDLMNSLEKRFQLNLQRIKPRQTPRQQARDYGDRLWERNPDRCCHIRKTIPLRQALSGFYGVGNRAPSRSIGKSCQYANRQPRPANRPDQDRAIRQLDRRHDLDLCTHAWLAL